MAGIFLIVALASAMADDIEGGGFGPPSRSKKRAADAQSARGAANDPSALRMAITTTPAPSSRVQPGEAQTVDKAQIAGELRQSSAPQNGTGILRLAIMVNGKPGAAHLILQDAAGKMLANLPRLPGGWAEGELSLRLPAGYYNVTASAGPRSFPWQGAVEVKPNAVEHCVANIAAYGDVSDLGWRLCDPYVEIGIDLSPCARFPAVFDDLFIAARGEGLEVAGFAGLWDLLAPQGKTYGEMINGQEMLTQAIRQAAAAHLLGLAATAENEATCGFFYTLSPTPLRLAANSSLRTRLSEVRDRGGAVVVHRVAECIYGDGGRGDIEAAAAFILRLFTGPIFQAMDIGGDSRDLEIWQALLQMGYRLPAIAGGPGQIAPRGSHIPAAGCYVLLPPQACGPSAFFTSLQSGRIVVSNGPFIRLLVDGAGVGDTIPPSSASRQVLIEAIASSYAGDEIDGIELIYNGSSLGKWAGAPAQKGIRIRALQEFGEPGWIIAHYRSRRRDLWAFTNPIYVQSGRLGQPPPIAGDLTILLCDRQSGAALAGTAEVWSGGACCATFSLSALGQRIAVPFDAALRIVAAGYAVREIWPSEEISLRGRLSSILAARPPAAWLAPETLQACRDAMANLSLIVALERDTAAVDAGEAEIDGRQRGAAEDANCPALAR